jgi:predicted transcriptional regulator
MCYVKDRGVGNPGRGPMTIYALAKLLHRHYKNVHDDVKALENIGLVEKDETGRYVVPWEEITATTRLAA